MQSHATNEQVERFGAHVVQNSNLLFLLANRVCPGIDSVVVVRSVGIVFVIADCTAVRYYQTPFVYVYEAQYLSLIHI